MKLVLEDVDVYEARTEFWSGRILDGIAGGGSLYLKDRATDPWGFSIECDPDTQAPHAVHFEKGTIWSFCYIKPALLEREWPLFLADHAAGKKLRVRVENIFSDGFNLDLVSENACMLKLLVWHYPPKRPGNGSA